LKHCNIEKIGLHIAILTHVMTHCNINTLDDISISTIYFEKHAINAQQALSIVFHVNMQKLYFMFEKFAMNGQVIILIKTIKIMNCCFVNHEKLD